MFTKCEGNPGECEGNHRGISTCTSGGKKWRIMRKTHIEKRKNNLLIDEKIR